MLQANTNTEQQRLTGLKIFGWVETIIGAIGSFILLILLLFFVANLDCQGQGCLGLAAISGRFILCIPFPFLLWAGIAVLKLQSIARRINYIILLLLIIPVALSIILVIFGVTHGFRTESRSLILIVILLIPISSIIWFLESPKAREQFRKP